LIIFFLSLNTSFTPLGLQNWEERREGREKGRGKEKKGKRKGKGRRRGPPSTW
jgi:hypothetical protein